MIMQNKWLHFSDDNMIERINKTKDDNSIHINTFTVLQVIKCCPETISKSIIIEAGIPIRTAYRIMQLISLLPTTFVI